MAGHSSERRLDAYDSGNENERFAIKYFSIPPRLLFKKMLATVITGALSLQDSSSNTRRHQQLRRRHRHRHLLTAATFLSE